MYLALCLWSVIVIAWSIVAFDWLPATWPRITGKLPGYLSPSAGLKFADVPNGLAAISKVPAAGWGQILAYMAFCEVSQDQSPGTPAAAGDFGFKVLTSSDPEEKTKKLSAELANGRLAMMAIIGMFFQEIISCFMIFMTLEDMLWYVCVCCWKRVIKYYVMYASISCHSFASQLICVCSLWCAELAEPTTRGCLFYYAGWPDRQRLGRLGQLHCISFASIREWAGCASTSWVACFSTIFTPYIYILIISYIVNVAYLCFGIICCEMLK